MPTISDPVTSQHATVLTGIYIARDADTLGPYNSLEAAALVAGGYLRADDYAARNGDTAWVSLSEFLPLSAVTRAAGPAPVTEFVRSTAETHPHRWRHLAAAFAILLLAALVAANGMHWFGHRRADESPAAARPSPTAPTLDKAAPLPVVALPPAAPQASTPAPVPDGPVNGSLSAALPGSARIPLAGVRVSIYPLAAVEISLAPIHAEAQAARVRLDPLIEAAAAECATRDAEARTALRVLREAGPTDPLIASLRFANTGAKAAAKTAGNDYRYLLAERTAAAGAEVYFRGLPEPVLTADTDAEGNFTLPLSPGDEPYAVAASARQTADDGAVRLRYWLVKLSPAQRSGRESVRLDGSNVVSSPAADSLVHTAD